jgi:hypothetical protein
MWRSRSGGEEAPVDRLDEEKLEMLRTWGEGLLNDGRDELRAAGRAISMLVSTAPMRPEARGIGVTAT